jgi:hypothetical protein
MGVKLGLSCGGKSIGKWCLGIGWPKRDERTGDWRKLRNEELHSTLLTKRDVCDKIKTNVMGGACGMYGEGRGIHKDLVGKPLRKIPLGRPSITWKDIIKTDF